MAPAPVRPLLLLAALAFAAGAACYTGPNIDGTKTSSSPTEPTGGSNVVASGLPCDVASFLQAHCAECHSSTPRGGAKTTLTTREALLGSWEGRPLAEVALERMKDTATPMPPGGLLAESNFAAFAKWVDDGMPEGSCDTDPSAAAPIELTCTSGKFWTEGDEGDKKMSPGQACITCHSKENGGGKTKEHDDDDDEGEEGGDDDAPMFTAAGTVYPTLHEPDDCFGLGTAGTTVVLTGADGKKVTLSVNSAGNFFTEQAIALPYTASVIRGGKSRSMQAAQTDGDCNNCHTAEGGEAPGRIVAP